MSQEIKETMTGPISTSLPIQASFLTNVTVNIDGGYHSNSPTLTTAMSLHHRVHDAGGGMVG